MKKIKSESKAVADSTMEENSYPFSYRRAAGCLILQTKVTLYVWRYADCINLGVVEIAVGATSPSDTAGNRRL